MRYAVGRHRAAIGLVLGTVFVAGGGVWSAPAQSAAPLSAADRIDIQQLIAQYSYVLDAAPLDAQRFAELFVPDGVLITPEAMASGRQGLAEASSKLRSGPRRPTLAANIVLDGAGGRAAGRVYVLEIHESGAGGPASLGTGGHFQDEYVRTPEGWKFARRQFFPSRLDQGK